jgi:A/G-specific adenine glycosylase
LCDACPLAGHCVALQSGRVQQLPVKEKAITIKQRWFYYIIIEYRGQLFIRKRSGKDIWQNLHEFLLYESATELQLDDNAAVLPLQSLLGISRFSIRHISPLHRQQLTHQRVSGQFIHLIAAQKPRLGPGFIAVAPPQIRQYAFPRLITDYLDRSAS